MSLSGRLIPSDGDCLYSALVYQLGKFGVSSTVHALRTACADHIKGHAEDFIAFLESDLDAYCNKVQNYKT